VAYITACTTVQAVMNEVATEPVRRADVSRVQPQDFDGQRQRRV